MDSKKDKQFKDPRVRFVGESNSNTTRDPSEENTERVMTGAGAEYPEGTTVKMSPRGNFTPQSRQSLKETMI